MVKGTTRQVIVVKSPDPDLFEQAIFLVKEKALVSGGITDQDLLIQARQACRRAEDCHYTLRRKLLWFCIGAVGASALWLSLLCLL